MADIRYNFIATGATEVISSFKTITQSAKEAERQLKTVDKAQAQSSKAKASEDRAAKKAATDLERATAKAAAEQEKAAKKVAAAQEKAAAQATRAVEQAAKAQEKAAAAATKAQEKAAQQAARAQEKAAAQSARAKEKAAAKAAKAEARIAAQEARKKEQLKRAEDRKFDQLFKQQSRLMDQERKRGARQYDRLMAERQRNEEKRQRAAAKEQRARQARMSNIRDGIGRRFLSVAQGATLAGAAIAGVAVRDNMRLNETSTRLAISARDSGGKMMDPRALAKEFQDVATSTPGVKANEVADAAGRFAALTGDLDTARKSLKTFATIASATGSDVGEIAEAAASLSNQLGIKEDSQFKEVFSALIAQGKGGAFELADMAAQFQRLAASGGAFGVEQNVSGVKTLGGFTQIARAGTGSSDQAATAVEAVLTNLKVKAGDLKKAGVNVYDKSGKTRNLTDVLVDTISNVGGTNIAKKNSQLSSLFGAYGGRALNPLVTTFQSTFNETSGTNQERLAAATAAVRAQFEKATQAAGTWADVTYEASVAQSMTSSKLTASWQQFSSRVGDQLTPVVADLLAKFADLAQNTSLVDQFIFTLEAFANAVTIATDVLIALGLLKKKEMTPEEKAAKAKQDLANFDATNQGAISPALADERAKLVEKVKETEAKTVMTSAQVLKEYTPEEFAAEYNRLGNHDPRDKRAPGQYVESEVRNDDWSNNDFLFGMGSENEEQKRFRHNYAAQLTYEKTRTNPQGSDSEAVAMVDEKMKALGAAAESATQSLNRVAQSSQGSITPFL